MHKIDSDLPYAGSFILCNINCTSRLLVSSDAFTCPKSNVLQYHNNMIKILEKLDSYERLLKAFMNISFDNTHGEG